MVEEERLRRDGKPVGRVTDDSGLAPEADEGPRSPGGWRVRVLVFGVFVIPILLYAAVPAVAALPQVPPGRKVAFSAALVILAEATFLVSALVLGREAVRRYRRYLSPRYWFGRSGRG